MTVKAKRFRIGVEGATTDGREIQREWLVQMAASYNPTVYTAQINLEHIKGYSPDSTFKRYGHVTGLTAEEITEGPLKGKMALYADINPSPDLISLIKQWQKQFTSNLSIYWQEDTRRRSVIDNPKRDRIENFESVNEAYVVEDYRCAALVENIEIGDFSAPAAPEGGE